MTSSIIIDHVNSLSSLEIVIWLRFEAKCFFAKFCLFSSKLAILFCFFALSRLARFSSDYARQGQVNVENVASANRPSVLERKFVDFRDYERMDAVYALQRLRCNSKVRDQWTDEFLDKYVACMIFEVC